MRFKVELITSKLPISYQMCMVSLIKKSISTVDSEYFTELYKFDDDKDNKKIKPFTFSVFLSNYKLQDNEFLINDKVILTVSSADYNFGINMYNGLLGIEEFNYKNKYSLKIGRITLVKEKSIKQDEAIFKTLSPIYLKDKHNQSIDMLRDSNTIDVLNYISNLSLKSFRGYGLKKELKFTPVMMKKQVLKQEISKFTEQTNKKYFMINSYSGIFKLEGDREDLNLLQQLGLGFRRSEGLGNIELV